MYSMLLTTVLASSPVIADCHRRAAYHGCYGGWAPAPAIQLDAGDLTLDLAKTALLQRMRAPDAGPLSELDVNKVAAAPVEVDPGGRRASWGPFLSIDLDKRRYTVTIRDRARKDGHFNDFEGEFEKVAGRWLATRPNTRGVGVK